MDVLPTHDSAPPLPALPAYRVTFDRIGRYHHVPPLETDAIDADHLSVRIFQYVRPRLFSGQVNVHVDLAAGRGWITVGGVRPAGECVIERLDRVAVTTGGEVVPDAEVVDR